MLPGKKYTPEDFLRIAWTRKWFIVIPAAVIAAATFAWSYSLPNRYRSQTTILVIPQRVPETFVRSTVTADVSERLTTISQQILSRTRLERIVEEFNLYPKERQTLIMEDVIAKMRSDVNVDVATPRRRGDDASSFTVSFESSQPRIAMQVTDRLASMFVQENLQDRELLADSTNQFLQAQLEDARRRLVEHETKVEEFRRRNAGRLPSEVQANIQMMQTTQQQIQANADNANHERDRLIGLEAAIADTSATARDATAPATVESEAPAGTAVQQLAAARANLRNMELRFKPDHPDVGRAKRMIAELEVKAEAEALMVAVSTDSTAGAPAGLPTAAAARLFGMRREAEEIRARLETRKKEDERLRGVMIGYTSRLETAPTLESELTALTRDYSTLQEQYTTLLRKSEESKLSVNLERRQISEQFRVVDGARLPERPISPDRVRYNLMGLGGGFAFGIALVALLAYRDTTLKTDEDIVITLALPVLAVIPAMVTRGERRRIKRRRIVFAVSASLATVCLVAAAVAWKLRLIQDWVR